MSTTIREARMRHAVGVRELARRCGVAPGTVQAWERAEERDAVQVSTLQRALRAMGEEPVISTRPSPAPEAHFDRKEQRLGLELHRKVAGKLIDDPEGILHDAANRSTRLRSSVHGPLAQGWVDEWQSLIKSENIGALVKIMVGGSQRDIDMRQVSPFDGLLTRAERVEVLVRASA